MAGRGEGPVRDEGPPEVTPADYGPQTGSIMLMIDECDRLTDEQLGAMAGAYIQRGPSTDNSPWHAALQVSKERMEKAAQARADLKLSIESNSFGRDPDLFRVCSMAAGDAALAVATRDLIGQHGYYVWDYDKLLFPWRVGVGDPE